MEQLYLPWPTVIYEKWDEIRLIFSSLQRAGVSPAKLATIEGNLVYTELGCFFTVSKSSGIFSCPMFGYSWQWFWFWWSRSGGHGCFEAGETGKFHEHRPFTVLLAMSSPVVGFFIHVNLFFSFVLLNCHILFNTWIFTSPKSRVLNPMSYSFSTLRKFFGKLSTDNDYSCNAIMHIFCKVCVGMVPQEISRHSNDIKLTWHILNGLERRQLTSLNMKRNCWAGVLHRSQGDCLFCNMLYKTENITIASSWYRAWEMVNKEKAWLWMHVISVSWTKVDSKCFIS